MSVVALEAVVEKGAIRLDSLWDIPDQTKVFVVIPDVADTPSEVPVALEPSSVDAPEYESVMELAKRLQKMALIPRKEKTRLTDFAGVGKELWSSIDVDAYIEEERNSWERSWSE